MHKSQVKIWQHFANGINHGLLSIYNAVVGGKFDGQSTATIAEGIKPLQANANALYTSLNEERLFSEEEIKKKQLKNEKILEEFIKGSSE